MRNGRWTTVRHRSLRSGRAEIRAQSKQAMCHCVQGNGNLDPRKSTYIINRLVDLTAAFAARGPGRVNRIAHFLGKAILDMMSRLLVDRDRAKTRDGALPRRTVL